MLSIYTGHLSVFWNLREQFVDITAIHVGLSGFLKRVFFEQDFSSFMDLKIRQYFSI